MIDDFLLRAILAALGAALAAGPLGCFVVWRRMAYFGDASAHAAILGVALSLALGAPVALGVLAAALAMALFVSRFEGRGHSVDSILGVAAHSALALGLLAAAMLPGRRVDLDAYLFGDVLTATWIDLVVIWGGAALILGMLLMRWRPMIAATLNADLAAAEGGNPARERLLLTLALALLVAVAIKAVGALLITALLIIPAAAARMATATPEGMALGAAGIGAASALGGVGASMLWDAPAGPAIVSVAVGFFAVFAVFERFRSA